MKSSASVGSSGPPEIAAKEAIARDYIREKVVGVTVVLDLATGAGQFLCNGVGPWTLQRR